ncbi:MAG: hypothetical protein L0H73_12975 [Nitrococcus sp.]|nr:hypothetical protein [Nitrococcus sp.]
MIPRSVASELFPEFSRGQDSNRQFVGDLKEVAVPGDQHLGARGHSFREDWHVRLIPYCDGQCIGLWRYDRFPAQKSVNFLDEITGNSHFLSQHSL